MIDVYSLALGLHVKDKFSGEVLWDVHFDNLTKEKRHEYLDFAKAYSAVLSGRPVDKSDIEYLNTV